MDDRGLPMHVLLVTDDEGYGDDVASAGDAIGAEVTVLAGGSRLDETMRLVEAHAIVFDAQDHYGLVVDRARTLASANPALVVCVVATAVDDHVTEGLFIQHRWRTPERLLDRLAAARARMAERVQGTFSS